MPRSRATAVTRSRTRHASVGTGTEIGNKHCGQRKPCPKTGLLTILKEQRGLAGSTFTHATITAGLSTDVFYRITVTNNTSTDYTLAPASDPLCATIPDGDAIQPSGTETVSANGGTVVYTCDVDANPGVGDIPASATVGHGPYTLTNTVSIVATPVGGGSSVTLTDTVTASLN